ncbi:MAG: chitinase [Mucilaginibacter sp.]|uniref:chitinase n=1 Tax=Mucilaginibacter sp. TaxID=1882438 RepID=UPI0034E40A69
MKRYASFSTLILSFVLMTSFKCPSSTEIEQTKVISKVPFTTMLSQKTFEEMFPQRDPFYTYASFTGAIKALSTVVIKVEKRDTYMFRITRTDRATGKSVVVRQDADWNQPWAKAKTYTQFTVDFGAFCADKNMATSKRELAAFLAQVAHETRHGRNGQYDDGLMFLHEVNTSLPYVDQNDVYPAVAGKKYYGRGPMQISYNGNYGFASDCIFGDKNKLLQNPDLITTDAVTAFKTAIYFWMMPQEQKPSAHDVMAGNWKPTAADAAKGRTAGFGMTTNIINGEVECGRANQFGPADRAGFYQAFLKKLNVTDANCVCTCEKMQAYE